MVSEPWWGTCLSNNTPMWAAITVVASKHGEEMNLSPGSLVLTTAATSSVALLVSRWMSREKQFFFKCPQLQITSFLCWSKLRNTTTWMPCKSWKSKLHLWRYKRLEEGGGLNYVLPVWQLLERTVQETGWSTKVSVTKKAVSLAPSKGDKDSLSVFCICQPAQATC